MVPAVAGNVSQSPKCYQGTFPPLPVTFHVVPGYALRESERERESVCCVPALSHRSCGLAAVAAGRSGHGSGHALRDCPWAKSVADYGVTVCAPGFFVLWIPLLLPAPEACPLWVFLKASAASLGPLVSQATAAGRGDHQADASEKAPPFAVVAAPGFSFGCLSSVGV